MRTTTVIIGAGHAGLAKTRKTERWDTLRLLTPNGQSRLPGYGYEGDDPGGYRALPRPLRSSGAMRM